MSGENSATALSDIIIKQHNEVFVRVDCERSTAQELHDHFSFYVPGYKYMPAYKSRMWDGKIRLYNLNNQRIYKGLIREVKRFAEDRDYTLEVEDKLESANEFSVLSVASLFKV